MSIIFSALTAILGLIGTVLGLLTGSWNFLGDSAEFVFSYIAYVQVRDWAWRLWFVPPWAENLLMFMYVGFFIGLLVEHVGNVILSGMSTVMTIKSGKQVTLKLDNNTNKVIAGIIVLVGMLVMYCWPLLILAGIIAIIILVIFSRRRHP